jgi:hypothetical protein
MWIRESTEATQRRESSAAARETIAVCSEKQMKPNGRGSNALNVKADSTQSYHRPINGSASMMSGVFLCLRNDAFQTSWYIQRPVGMIWNEELVSYFKVLSCLTKYKAMKTYHVLSYV